MAWAVQKAALLRYRVRPLSRFKQLMLPKLRNKQWLALRLKRQNPKLRLLRLQRKQQRSPHHLPPLSRSRLSRLKVVKPAVSVPTAPTVSEDVKVAAKPVEAKKPEGLDADLVLARPNVTAAPSAGRSVAAKPRRQSQ